MSARFQRVQMSPPNRMGHVEIAQLSHIQTLFSALGVSSGIVRLASDLTLNGQTVSPTFRYEGASATVATWTATVGNNLPTYLAGTDPTVGDLTPFTNAGETSVYFQQGKVYAYTNSSYADISDDNADVVFETVFQYNPTGGESTVFGKYLSATSKGYAILVDATDALVIKGIGAATVTTLTQNAWYHVMGIIDRNGNTRWYVNGVAITNAATTAGSQVVATALEMGSYDVGTGRGANSVAYAAMWMGPAGWVGSSANQDAVVKERFARMTGVYASIAAVGTEVPTVMTRASAGSLDRTTSGSVRQTFLVGANWPRVCVRDSTSGFLSEVASTNSLLRSGDFTNATWVKSNSTVVTGFAAPNGRNEAFGVKPTVGNTQHVVYQVTALTGGSYVSIWAKKGSNDWLCIRLNGGGERVFFNLNTGTIGTQVHFGNPLNPSIENWGNGWYRCGCGPSGGVNTVTFYTTNADNVLSYNETSGASVGTYMWGPMKASGSIYGAQMSYIPTAAASVTRQIDNLQYNLAGNYNSPSGTLMSTVWASAYASGSWTSDMRFLTVSDGSVNNANQFGGTTNLKGLFKVVAASATQVSGTTATNVCQSAGTIVKAAYTTNNFAGSVNTVVEVTDNTVTPPTQATGAIYVGQEIANNYQPAALIGTVRILAGFS